MDIEAACAAAVRMDRGGRFRVDHRHPMIERASGATTILEQSQQVLLATGADLTIKVRAAIAPSHRVQQVGG